MYSKDAILYARGDWPRVLYNIYNMYNVYSVYNIYKYVIKKGRLFAFPFLFAIVLRESRGCSERSERNASGVAKPPCAERVSVSIIYNICSAGRTFATSLHSKMLLAHGLNSHLSLRWLPCRAFYIFLLLMLMWGVE